MAMDNVVASSSVVEIRATLDRIVASESFRASPQLASFLRFVVEATLAGRADRIKGYSIAVGALGRNDSFDPQTNPIVRVEAGRLRRALENYYGGPGRQDRIVIELPRGSYIPRFGRRTLVHRLRAFVAHGRRLIPRVLRRRFRFVTVVVCISAGVSVTFDAVFLLAQRGGAPMMCPQVAVNELAKADAPNSSSRMQ